MEEYSGPKDGEFYDGKTWRPGIRFEVRDSGYLYDPDQVAIADGMGQMVLEVVSRHKPGKFPERTFFLRSFVDPNGRAFGKARLRVTTTPAFKRMAAGYRHEFEMAAQPTTSAKGPDHGR
ncbi:hypothetical protein CS345_17375 [Bordetella bronchiseptica]|nr:hypothetical protein CS345_14950 [Bordetella bronchiseptica]AZW24468.1 hypothetical protein CS345_17375 [Bordetella bronchiseptica]